MTLDVTAEGTAGVVAPTDFASVGFASVLGDVGGGVFADVGVFASGKAVGAGADKAKLGAGRKIALPSASKKVLPSHRKM